MSLWENEAAMRTYESGDILQKTILPQLKPFFSVITRQHAARSGSQKNLTDRYFCPRRFFEPSEDRPKR